MAGESFNTRSQTKGLQQGKQSDDDQDNRECPHCGTPARASADLCEACGKWMLQGQCCFCYAPLNAEQRFCKKCGNPPKGITCPRCSAFSNFDFCPQCETPLSKGTKDYLEAMQQSEEFVKLKELSQQAVSIAKDSQTTVVNQLDQLSAYMKQFDESRPAQSLPAFIFNNENKDVSAELARAEQTIQAAENAESKEADNLLRQKIILLQQQAFEDNQSARKFYTAIKLLLPELQLVKTKRIIGWLCNYANVLHIEGPTNCGGPSEGGRWIYEDDTVIATVLIER